jgi:UDP-N-acetylmuramate dehydrogenase
MPLKNQKFSKSVEILSKSIRGEVLLDELMLKHTSFKIGGPAEIFIRPYDANDLITALKWAKSNKMPIFVMGNGTNIIVSDSGIEGVVIKISDTFSNMVFNKNEVLVQAGVSLQRFLEEGMRRNLGGMEFAWGIPGAIGGSVAMNAGSNSHFLSTRVKYVNVIDYNGKIFKLNHDELKFDYRYSRIQDENLILIDALFELESKELKEIEKEREINMMLRKEKQPINYPCAGSVFKNPPTTYAGRVLDEAGCKGLRIGDAQISELHANFIVNLGNATAHDIVSLIQEAQMRVYKLKDLMLELEIKLIGNFRDIKLMEKKK